MALARVAPPLIVCLPHRFRPTLLAQPPRRPLVFPALALGLRSIANPDAPTFQNTIEAMERSGGKAKGNVEAMGWANDGVEHTDTILVAAAAGKWDKVKAAATPMGAVCGTCHTKYRERRDDGTFRIKAGSFK